MISVGKTLGEVLYENDVELKNSLDVEFNKKNRVTVAQFASKEAIANTPHSPRFKGSIPQESDVVKQNSENSAKVRESRRLKPIDKEYLAAVKNGYIKIAERMVDEVAQDAGCTIKAYHGSRAEFTVFDKNLRGSNTKTETSYLAVCVLTYLHSRWV